MNYLSVFDGMSCGRIAIEQLGLPITKYYASEIDRYAIKVAHANYPDTVHIGDIRGIRKEYLPKIDVLMGGSPCQGFSFAGKQLNFNDPRSALFFEFVRLLHELKPRYFLLENVRMKKEYQDVISSYLGVEPVMINSSLVSAQNRVRFYWTNIPNVTQPTDRGIMLADIIKDGLVNRQKSFCLDANYFKGGNLKNYFEKHRRQLIFFVGRGNNPRGFRAFDGKTPTLSTNSWEHNNFLATVDGYRKLTPTECERLQTVPDGYTDHVSNTQRYKMLGNGWTVDVIKHIFKGIK